MVVAIVLAGGSKNDLMEEQSIPVNEALIRIGNKHMVEYVVDALRGSSYIDRTIIAGHQDKLREIFGDTPDITLVQSGEMVIDTFKKATTALSDSDKMLLVLTADIPLLTSEAIDDFLKTCFDREGDLFYPIVNKEMNEMKFPGVVRTYANLQDGIFTGGNLFFLKTEIIERCLPVAEQLVRYRKKPVRLASYIGWNILIRYLLGMLSLEGAEKAVSNLMSIKGVAVISSYPEVGIDVDKNSDLELAKKYLCS